MVNTHDAKTHFSKLLARVEKGEQIVIARAGKPVALLSPVPPQRKRRVPGTAKGKLWMSKDFDSIPEAFKRYT